LIVYFTTVVRAAPQQRGGELVKLDWERKRIEARVPMAPVDPPVVDPNPRGSTRGGRGVLLDGDELFAASYHSLDVFDRDLRPVRRVSNGLFAGLHELAWQEDTIWASATCIDCAARVDRSGRLLEFWSPREDPVVAERLKLPSLAIDPRADNRTCNVTADTLHPGHVHLNAVAVHEGRPLVLLNRYGMIVRLKPTEILVDDASLRGCHNLVVSRRGSILVNDTVRRAIRVYDRGGKPVKTIELLRDPAMRRIRRRHVIREVGCWLAKNGRPHRVFGPLMHNVAVAKPLFLRGLCETSTRTLLVGISPASILEVDVDTGEVVDAFQFSKNVHVCVHGLACRETDDAELIPRAPRRRSDCHSEEREGVVAT
jgi:hypothetical protein